MAVQYGASDSLRVELAGPYGGVSIRVSDLTLQPDSWKGAVSPFAQTVAVEGVTRTSKVDLQPEGEILEQLRTAGCALAAENEEGLVTVYAFGTKPEGLLTLQATITEVSV